MSRYESRRLLYDRMPAWVKSPVRWVPFGLVAGASYRRVVARGPEIDRLGRSELRAYQERALAEVLRFAVEQVPAYRRLRALVERHKAFDALKEFPLLAKDDLQGNLANYLPRDFDRRPHYECTTGGTSGNQLKFFVDDDSQSVETAFMHRQWARVGYTPRCRKATFRGVDFSGLRDGVFWKANPVYNELQFSPFHMSDGTLGAYWEQLERYRPQFLHGYPSAISLLAGWVERSGVSGRSLGLRAVLLGSEGLEPGQRELVERAFGARAYSWYGHSERVILGGECEVCSAYHQFPDYGALEFIGDGGEPVTGPGQRGELVGTGLLNRSLPLIRYRTGDRARLLPPECECGRAFDRFDEVEGRWEQDYVIGAGGAKISIAALNMHGPLFDRVARYQYYQKAPGAMDLRVVPAPGFDESDAAALAEAYRRKVGDGVAVRVVVVSEIPLTARGKLKRLVQETPPQGDPKTT
jgi:phenylacetate-coenzyme A ligase PaaK-like adenylate-forming protein